MSDAVPGTTVLFITMVLVSIEFIRLSPISFDTLTRALRSISPPLVGVPTHKNIISDISNALAEL